MPKASPEKSPNTSPTLPLGSTASGGSMPPAVVITTFPSQEDHDRVRHLKLLVATDDDLWRLHSYRYAFRRLVLGDGGAGYPVDPEGAWFDSGMVGRAAAFFRKKFGVRTPAIPPAPTSDSAIRTNCREIGALELTSAERAELAPAVTALAQDARQAIADVIERGRAAFRERHTTFRPPAQEMPAPKVFERAALTPQRAEELTAIMEHRQPRQVNEQAERDEEPPPASEEDYGSTDPF